MDKGLSRYYFTFGSAEHFPYERGEHVVVMAPTLHSACLVFRAVHPDHTEGTLNCADFYTENQWNEAIAEGHFTDSKCVEVISVARALIKLNDLA